MLWLGSLDVRGQPNAKAEEPLPDVNVLHVRKAHVGAGAPAGGFLLSCSALLCRQVTSLAGSWPPARTGFSENSPYLQGGFENQKSKKKNADQPRVAV